MNDLQNKEHDKKTVAQCPRCKKPIIDPIKHNNHIWHFDCFEKEFLVGENNEQMEKS